MAGLTWRETFAVNLTLLRMTFFLLYISLFGRFRKRANGRPMNRVLYDETCHFVLSHLSVRQLQALSGTTLAGYAKWAKQTKNTEIVDDLGNDARLMWVGPREKEHVVIYCHGGGFVGPLSDFQVEFWYRVQQSLSKNHNGLKLGVAVLQYSIYPASFPTQLNQLLLAIEHVISMGVPSSKIYLAGDSAGGNMVLQLLSHIHHPSALASQMPSPSILTGFAGVCLISPWILPDDLSESGKTNDSFDLLPANCLLLWKDTYLSSTPESHKIYVQVDKAPEGWFTGLDNLANRIIVTAGRNEILHDSILRLTDTLKKSHNHVELDVQDSGVHCDAMFDIGAKSKAPHPVEKRITEWFADTMRVEKA